MRSGPVAKRTGAILLGSLVLSIALLLQGCVSNHTTRRFFMTPGITPAQWTRIDAECEYEGDKAVAAAHWKQDTSIRQTDLYIQCVELKGATHVGKVRMQADVLDRIEADCKQDTNATFAGRPMSMTRHQQQEEAEITCMKRKGVTFDPAPW
jgi:hypothetical protein